MPGTLFVVATPIGNLEDITARALRILREVAIIAAEDTRRTAHLLARYTISTPTTSLHEHNEAQKAAALVDRLRRGEHVALVSDAGTPTISDPGRLLIGEAVKAGIRVESVPGPSAAVAALAVSGFHADSFCFMGFPPTRSQARKRWFERVRTVGGTIVFYEAPHRLRDTLRQLHRAVGNCDVVVCRELTKLHEELVRGPISVVSLGDIRTKGEFTIVATIGQETDKKPIPDLSGQEALHELGELTAIERMSRRRAIGLIARRHNASPNEVYELIEKALKSTK